MLDLNLYLIIFVFLFFTALFMILQIKLEKKLLKNFPQNNSYIKKFISEEAPLNEFSIPLIMLSWLPLSARGRTVLFNYKISNHKIQKMSFRVQWIFGHTPSEAKANPVRGARILCWVTSGLKAKLFERKEKPRQITPSTLFFSLLTYKYILIRL